jgi:O-antigen ligase
VAVLLVSIVYSLLIARVIIPGSFDYDPNTNILAVAARDAVFNKITWLSFLLIPVALMASRSTLALRLVRANPYFLLLLAFATLSVLWSVDPGSSSSRVTHALTIVLDCLLVAVVGWTATRVQGVTRPIVTILLLGSLLFGLYAPELAVTPPTPPDTNGYWHGLTTQKNQLGSLASIGVILWFHGWAAREVSWLPALVGGALSMACLLLSRSSTALMATALVVMFTFLMLRSMPPAMRRYMPYIVGLFVAVTLAYSLAVLKVVPGLDVLLKPITALSGKDSTFTARTQIWDIIRAHIAYSPLIGSGYGGYWGGPVPSSPSFIFLGTMYFYPNEAHNGYLDIINDLGYIGLLLLLGYLVTYIRQALRLLKSNYSQAALYLALMFQQLLTNLSESHWLFIGHDFIILTVATFGLARSLMDAPPSARRR